MDVVQDGFDSFRQRLHFLYSVGIHNDNQVYNSGYGISVLNPGLTSDNNYPYINADNKNDVLTSAQWSISLLSTHDQYLYYYNPEKKAVLADKPSDFA